MNALTPTPAKAWWLRKRIMLPPLFLAALLAASVSAYEASDTSTVVIYNETGDALPPLLVRIGGQSRTYMALADQESVRLSLKEGAGGAVHLELASEPPWKWDGASIQSHGGFRVSIRLLPGGQAEAFTDISCWRRILD